MGLKREDGQSRGPFTKQGLLRYATKLFFYVFLCFSPSSSKAPSLSLLRCVALARTSIKKIKIKIGCRKRNPKPSKNPFAFPLRVHLQRPMSQRIIVVPRGTCISPTKTSQQCKHPVALLLVLILLLFFFVIIIFFFCYFCYCYFSSHTNNNRIRPREHMVQSRAQAKYAPSAR